MLLHQVAHVQGGRVQRSGLGDLATQLVDASGLPFTTAYQDKSTLDESHPRFMGMYMGKFANPEVNKFFSSCDAILGLGPVRHYFNTGFFTAEYDVSKTINVQMHEVRAGNAVYANVEMKDVIEQLIERLPKRTDIKAPSGVTPFGEPTGAGSDPIDTGDPFYAQAAAGLARFFSRIQARSETHPELDGGWFRAFDSKRWDYWASNADLGWGAWSIESGWTQAWITSVLALRRMNTSFWELTSKSRIAKDLDTLVAVMLPDVKGRIAERETHHG